MTRKIHIQISLTLILMLTSWFASALVKSNGIQIETDKPIYISGERVWFKASALNEDYKTLFIDLCSEGQIVNSIIINKGDWGWQGSFMIPDSLETGVYALRAHTGQYNTPFLIGIEPISIINRFGRNGRNQSKKTTGNFAYNCFANWNDTSEEFGLKLNETYFQHDSVMLTITNHTSSKIRSTVSIFRVPELQNIGDNMNPVFGVEMELPEPLNNSTELLAGVIISGHVTQDETGKPAIGELIMLSIPDSIPQISYTYTQSNGDFKFTIDDYYGDRDAVVQTISKNKDFHIEVEQQNLPAPTKIPFYIPEYIEKNAIVTDAIIRFTIEKAYKSQTIYIKPSRKNLIPFYGNALSTIYPSDYIDLTDFIDISREIIPLSRLRFEKKMPKIKIYNPELKYFFEYPWIVVDGVPCIEPKSILHFNSKMIKKIEIQPEFRCYGNLFIPGVLSITTYRQDINDIQLPKNSQLVRIKTLNTQIKENQDPQNPNEPNFKNILYWNPSLQIEHETTVHFRTSFETGTYAVAISYIDEQGNIKKTVNHFTVSKK